jgi:hypothetical protein
VIDDKPARRREDNSIPPWMKLAVTVIGTTILAMGWTEARFVSRVEWANHQSQQLIDLAAVKDRQADYARAEVVTGQGLTELKVDVAEIKGDVSWLRSYLDVSQPLPKKKNGVGTHR